MTSEGTTLSEPVEADSQGDAGTTPVSHRVVHTVAEKRNADPEELEPLYYSMDPDVLDSLFSPPGHRSVKRLTFRYAGCEIRITEQGGVRVGEPGE